MAARRCPYTRGETVFHSDRGCQYTSEQFSQHLGRYEIIASTGRTGVCWDNAWAEVGGRHPSRNERVYQMVYPTRSKAVRDTASQVEPGTHAETTPLRPGAQDAGRGRPGAPSSKTSSLKDRFQGCPRHAQQSSFLGRQAQCPEERPVGCWVCLGLWLVVLVRWLCYCLPARTRSRPVSGTRAPVWRRVWLVYQARSGRQYR